MVGVEQLERIREPTCFEFFASENSGGRFCAMRVGLHWPVKPTTTTGWNNCTVAEDAVSLRIARSISLLEGRIGLNGRPKM